MRLTLEIVTACGQESYCDGEALRTALLSLICELFNSLCCPQAVSGPFVHVIGAGHFVLPELSASLPAGKRDFLLTTGTRMSDSESKPDRVESLYEGYVPLRNRRPGRQQEVALSCAGM